MPVLDLWEEANTRHKTTDKFNVRTYSRLFRAQVSLGTSPTEIESHASLPRIGTPYLTPEANDLGARCIRVGPIRPLENNPYVHDIPVEYSSKYPKQDDQEINPLMRGDRLRWRTERIRVPLEQDYTYDANDNLDRQAILNSAKDPFDPPIETVRRVLVLTHIRNEALFDPLVEEDLLDKINDAPFFGFPALTVLYDDADSQDQEENGFTFFVTTRIFKIDLLTWKLQVLDRGFYELVGGNRRPILDASGRPRSTPALLDGNGAVLDPPTDPPVYLTFWPNDRTDFSVFNI